MTNITNYLSDLFELIDKEDTLNTRIADAAAEAKDALVRDFTSLSDARVAAAVRSYFLDALPQDSELLHDQNLFSGILLAQEYIDEYGDDEDLWPFQDDEDEDDEDSDDEAPAVHTVTFCIGHPAADKDE